MIRLLVILAIASCATARSSGAPSARAAWPVVHLVGDVNAASVEAANAWRPLGFVATLDDPKLPECARHWYADKASPPCKITIRVIVDPRLLEIAHTGAQSDRTGRTVWIDASTAPYPARYALAHEVGHIVLDTPKHTLGGVMGGSTYWLTPVDYALACEAIGRGCGGAS
jgi:hypothetical protein